MTAAERPTPETTSAVTVIGIALLAEKTGSTGAANNEEPTLARQLNTSHPSTPSLASPGSLWVSAARSAPGDAFPERRGYERRQHALRLHAKKGHAMTVIPQWAPQIGYERRTFPNTNESWSPTESPVARYLLHLRALGIEDPTSYRRQRAIDFYQQALALREHSITVAAKQDGEGDIANRLAMGEIDSEQAAKLLAKMPTASDAQEQAARGRQMLAAATRAAYTAAVLAVHTYGDRWLDLLRPLVQEAVAAQDDARFEALHRFAALLRSPDIAALAMVASDTSGNREFDETWRYRTGRPDLVHKWRYARAERTHDGPAEPVGANLFVMASAVTKGPHPTLTEMVEHEMQPGMYSASDVLATTERVLADQEAAQVSAEVTS